MERLVKDGNHNRWRVQWACRVTALEARAQEDGDVQRMLAFAALRQEAFARLNEAELELVRAWACGQVQRVVESRIGGVA
jgi:hypothetical protein